MMAMHMFLLLYRVLDHLVAICSQTWTINSHIVLHLAMILTRSLSARTTAAILLSLHETVIHLPSLGETPLRSKLNPELALSRRQALRFLQTAAPRVKSRAFAVAVAGIDCADLTCEIHRSPALLDPVPYSRGSTSGRAASKVRNAS